MIDSILFKTLDDDAIPPKEAMRVTLTVMTDNPLDATLSFDFARYTETNEEANLESVGRCAVNLHTFRKALDLLWFDETPIPETELETLLRDYFRAERATAQTEGDD